MLLRCAVVDDEPPSLEALALCVSKTPFLHLAGHYGSALTALAALREQPVDLLFLDIEMPGLDGLALARTLPQLPHSGHTRVVFTTAYTHFAIESYKVDALDYLLKPFSYEDFLRVALKAQSYFDRARPALPGDDAALILKSGHKLVRVLLRDVLYVEGLKDYVKVYRAGPDAAPVVALGSLRLMEEKLPARQFLRIHRSFIVNLGRLDAVMRAEVQIGRALIPIGAQYREAFDAFLATWH